jgi:acetoin utilization deacetylase AcuC-like enzyme
MKTGYVYDESHRAHTHPRAPESAARLEALIEYLEDEGSLASCTRLSVEPIPWDWVAAVHTQTHIDAVRQMAREGKKRISFDTYMTSAGADVALLGASSGVRATQAVLDGRVRTAFSLMRTPGHHALSTRAMGYCIFNNVAVAAQYGLREHGLERIMIVDIDAHHGNGTEEIFYGSRDVLFISYHQHPWFPGTGDWHRNGAEAGLGYNYNVELPQWSGDEAYMRVFYELVEPLADQYKPQLILVSAGFDAHWMDHSSVLGLSVRGYYDLLTGLNDLADRLCEGRIVLLLEGGYNLQSLGASVAAAFCALRQEPLSRDPLGPCPDEPVASVDGILAHLGGFRGLMASSDEAGYYDQPVQVPYEIRS